jgi:hypothetical protein
VPKVRVVKLLGIRCFLSLSLMDGEVEVEVVCACGHHIFGMWQKLR